MPCIMIVAIEVILADWRETGAGMSENLKKLQRWFEYMI